MGRIDIIQMRLILKKNIRNNIEKKFKMCERV